MGGWKRVEGGRESEREGGGREAEGERERERERGRERERAREGGRQTEGGRGETDRQIDGEEDKGGKRHECHALPFRSFFAAKTRIPYDWLIQSPPPPRPPLSPTNQDHQGGGSGRPLCWLRPHRCPCHGPQLRHACLQRRGASGSFFLPLLIAVCVFRPCSSSSFAALKSHSCDGTPSSPFSSAALFRSDSLHISLPLSVWPLQFKDMFVEKLGYKRTDRETVLGSAMCAGVVAASFRSVAHRALLPDAPLRL